VQDQLGDENFNVFAVKPDDNAAAGSDVPAARNITEAKGVQAQIYAVPKSDPDLLYIGLNDRDKAWHDLYKIKISTGERTLLRQNSDRIGGWIFDVKDQLRLAVRSAENGDTEIMRVDPGKLTKIYSCDIFETCAPDRFHPDNKRFYMITNKGAGVDLIKLALMDPDSGKVDDVESDPMHRVDLGRAFYSDLTDRLLATVYDDERTRVYWKDKTYQADYKWLQSKLPGRQFLWGSRTKDENIWMVTASADVEPGETYLFDRKGRKLDLQYRIREKLPRESLVKMEAIRYKSSDGLEIPAYLSLPKGVPPRDLPLMVVPHGGPWARDSWGFRGMAQFLANRGYAVLSPNFRGSTGYGKKFVDAGNQQWGRKMQDDLTWGVKHLVGKGMVNPRRVGIMGGSYGGYATLAGVTFTPDLYAAGVAIVAPSNLVSLIEAMPAYWESFRKQLYARMADPNTPEGKKLLGEESPLNYASHIKTPLMVVQGANDPRVPRAEADRIVIALRDRNFPVVYLVAPDEGHGFQRPVNNMAMFAEAEKFLAKYLDGRYQSAMPPEVTTRLNEITVDPKTVTVAKKVDPGSVGVPKLAMPLQAGTYKYAAKMQLGGQSMNLGLTTTIKQENGTWTATDSIRTPMGEGTETAVMDKDSLVVVKKSAKQGPIDVSVDFKDNKATGSLTMNGQTKPVNTDTGGPLFADSAGAPQVIASLPLADGYSTTFRNFDLQKQKPKLMQLKVEGSEKVTVPAGTFEAYKVELTSAEGGPEHMTMWIAKEPRKAVKVVVVMPQMNGATLTAELE
jgi:dipeptidyl aminopeptidase/acylaminoacyl peptidase